MPNRTENDSNGYVVLGAKLCKKHGDVADVALSIRSKKLNGSWCMLCIVEKLEDLGVSKLNGGE